MPFLGSDMGWPTVRSVYHESESLENPSPIAEKPYSILIGSVGKSPRCVRHHDAVFKIYLMPRTQYVFSGYDDGLCAHAV